MPKLFVKFNPELRNYLHQLKGAPLAVFMTISLHTGRYQTAFPSVKRICRLTGYGERTVIYALRTLEKNKFIRILEHGGNVNGRNLSNVYAVCRMVGYGSEEQIAKIGAANWKPAGVKIEQPETQEESIMQKRIQKIREEMER